MAVFSDFVDGWYCNVNLSYRVLSKYTTVMLLLSISLYTVSGWKAVSSV
jgi:hypothetical protein